MVNDNIITTEMYHKVRGIIRGEIAHIYCTDCKQYKQDRWDCECNMMYSPMNFKPNEEYISRIARKICLSIGEPLYDDIFEEEIIE